MGICCEASSLESEELQEYTKKAPANLKDKIQVWEASLPFQTTSIVSYMAKLNAAYEDDGARDGNVTIESLARHFNTPAWEDLKNEQSELVMSLQDCCS